MSTFWFVRRPPCLSPRAESGWPNCHRRAGLSSRSVRAHTGDVSAEMLKDARASALIIGHSERRQHHGETDALAARKALAARRAGLIAILCVGEMQQQRASGAALSICGGQIVASVPIGMTGSALAIGYEPLWAIGSKQIPTSQEIVHMHAHIRRCLVEHLGAEGKCVRILYAAPSSPPTREGSLPLPERSAARL